MLKLYKKGLTANFIFTKINIANLKLKLSF